MTSISETIKIEPGRKWIYLDFKAIWQYRDLLFLIVQRDFKSRYKQTLLGPMWFVIQPIFMTLTFTVIFGKVAQISTDGVPHNLFYFSGIMCWGYFSSVFSGNSNTFQDNAHIFQKVYFPRLIVPLASACTSLFTLFIQLITFIAFFVYYKFFTESGNTFNATFAIISFPLIVLHMALLGLGCAMWMSSLTAKFRDLKHMFPFLVQVWMYATPVIYPISTVPDRFRWIMELNPLTSVFEVAKYGFLGTGTFSINAYMYSWVISLGIFISGMIIFQRVERTFVDTV